MKTKELKSATVYNKKGEKMIVKPNEQYMHGHHGVITITEITRRDNKKFTTTVCFKTMKGKQYATEAVDCGGGCWSVKLNVLFKI